MPSIPQKPFPVWYSFTNGSSFFTPSHSEHRKNAQEAIELITKILKEDECDTLILDEINNALQLKLIDLDQVKEILALRPKQMHLILTGRDAHPEIVELADTVSEVREIKHAYRKEIEPQPGIDF